jgi:signal transduction histidine kinase
VARHAGASRCTIRLVLDGALEVEICDDGRGFLAGYRPGVGLASMREWAAELGGSCTIGSAPRGGTRICVHLPIPQEL